MRFRLAVCLGALGLAVLFPYQIAFAEGDLLEPADLNPLSSRWGLFALLAAGILILLAMGGAALWRFYPRGEGTPLQRVAKNSLFPMATSFLNKLLDLGFAVYVFRALGPKGVGDYTFAVVVLGYVDILANFGLGTLLTREVARDRRAASRYLLNTLVVRIALWVASLAVVGLLIGPAAPLLDITPDVGLAILLLTLGLLPSLVSSTLSALFMAYEKFEYPSAVAVLTGVLKVMLGTIALVIGWGFVGLAGVSIVVNLATLAALLALMRTEDWGLRTELAGIRHRAPGPGLRTEVTELSPPSPRPSPEGRGSSGALSPQSSVLSPDFGFCWKMLRASYPLMLNNLLNSVFFRVDSLMIKPMVGNAALGWYSTAYKFIDGLGIISSSFTLALFPLLSQYAHSSRDSLARTFSLGLKLLLMASLPISVGTTLIASEIILLFAGPDYLPHSAIALQILIWFLPFSFANGLTQYLLIAVNRQRFITLSFVVATTFNLAANLVLIPPLGYVGAAITTVASEWVLMVPFWYCVRRDLPPIPLLSLAWRPALASAIMGVQVWAVREWSILLAVALAPAFYAAALLALRSFDDREVALLARLLPGRIVRWVEKLS